MLERVVVTGAQGFLGRHLVSQLLNVNESVVVMGIGRSERLDDRYTHELAWDKKQIPAPLPGLLQLSAHHPRYTYAPLDIRDPTALESLFEAFSPSVVIHAAAALRDEAWADLARSNVDTVIALCNAFAHYDGRQTPLLVLVSSGSVYGRTQVADLPLKEATPCLPLDLYAVSKRTAENVADILSAQHSIRLVIGRVFNLVGPGLQDRHLAGSLAEQLAAIKLGLRDPIIEVGPLDTSRDFIDVRDAATGLVILADSGKPGLVYNVASGRETLVRQILDELVSLAGLDRSLEIRANVARRNDVSRSVADIGRLRRLGFEPTVRLRQSLSDMLEYYLRAVASTSH